MPRNAQLVFVIVGVILLYGLFALPLGHAQARPLEYDYYSLALTSASNCASEAAKVTDIPQRIHLLVRAAKTFPATQRDEAVRLLEGSLRDLKDWSSGDKVSWFQRHTAEGLRTEVLAALATLDPQRAALEQKAVQSSEELSSTNEAAWLKQSDWINQFNSRRTVADQSAKIALSLIDSDIERAAFLVAQSLQGGTAIPNAA